ncbi:MAG: hypothetical protein NT049_02825, partial [Planctomycetota bacterium]|nr:hypothetical protein [Planctomycetota bacterium]
DRSRCYYDKGEIDNTIADCTSVLQMTDVAAEYRADAFWLRGLCRGRQDDPAGMEQDARAALAIASDSINARFVLALALLLANEVEAAKNEYGRAAERCRKAGDIRHIGIDELERAMEDRGYIPGADEILEMLCDREDELQ